MSAHDHITRHARTARSHSINRDWRCWKCFKLLGRRSGTGVHITFARGHQYLVSTPVATVCRSCGKLNELPKID